MQIESLDTNIFVRLIVKDDERQYRNATKLVLSNKSTQFLINDMAIAETVYVLKRDYGYSREDIRDKVLNLLEVPNFSFDRAVVTEVLDLFVAHPSWSFDDCYLIVKTAEAQAEPLWTFDHKLAVQSGVAKEVR